MNMGLQRCGYPSNLL